MTSVDDVTSQNLLTHLKEHKTELEMKKKKFYYMYM